MKIKFENEKTFQTARDVKVGESFFIEYDTQKKLYMKINANGNIIHKVKTSGFVVAIDLAKGEICLLNYDCPVEVVDAVVVVDYKEN